MSSSLDVSISQNDSKYSGLEEKINEWFDKEGVFISNPMERSCKLQNPPFIRLSCPLFIKRKNKLGPKETISLQSISPLIRNQNMFLKDENDEESII